MSAFIFILKALRAIAVIWVILYLYLKYAHTYWKRRGVPSLPGHWFFGNAKDALLMRKSPATVFGDLYHQASEDDDILGIYIAHKPFLVLRNPKLIKQILIKDFNYFSDRYFTARSIHDKIGSSALFTMKNPEWKYLRAKLTPVFTSGKVKNLFPLIVQTADSMKNYLENQFTNGTRTNTLPVREISLKYTTDIISSVAFGIQVNSFDPSQSKFFSKVQESLRLTVRRGLIFFCMFFFPAISMILGGQMLGSATNYFRKIFWDSMDTREVTKSKRGDLIDSLIDLKNAKQDNDFKFEGDALVAQAGIFFVAGRESSSTTISFTLSELAKHPDIQKRVRENILETLEAQGMTYEAVQSMKYLHQVMSEVLRLYPPAPLIDRVAVEDYKIPGTDTIIEKGTPIYIPLIGLQRDARYHPDPLTFNPDRFSDENKDNITPCSYMPFGDGPRICIAQRVGLLQSVVAVITILKDYEVSLDPTGDYEIDRRNIFLSPSDRFKLKFTKL
ncbi:cytochrome P450 6k1-like [Hylaeus volcanicus]|uniref:cytochrome P450 6k1-like n=1 Tax=Hylaeus volcanicus TaxID=313075 RepID=UPI0023B848F0|nr:cytochrome P450 6k1-like [Hylaeus volcanicus]